MKYDMGLIYICLFAICMSLRRFLLRSLAYFLICLFFVLLHFKRSLCNLDNNSLFDVYFANIFFHPVICLFILLALSFIEQKHLILMKSSLSIISFIDHAFDVVSKKTTSKK